MINDMASLRKAMEQMDAEDASVAEAAKDRAARILSDANMNFSKLAGLIEQRRLLLRPRIVTNIKKMDQPEMLGDAAFRDVSAALRREGQSFRQIAEALEVGGGTALRYEDATRNDYVPVRLWPRALAFAMRTVGYPLRHPIRFLIVALLALLLLNGLRDFVGLGRRISGYAGDISAARGRWDSAMSSVSSFFEKRLAPLSREAEAPPTSAAPTPSPSPASPPPSADPSTGPAATSAPPATAAEPPATKSAPSPAAPASPTARTPRLDSRSASPSNPATKDRRQTEPSRASDDVVPTRFRRNSRVSGRCVGGIGGCYWGGGQY